MLELCRVSKSFSGVRALDDVSLAFAAGEIHGLIGENGAGKSTAIRILTGLLQPDAGTIRLDGRVVSFADHRASLTAGIGLVPQERHIVPDASVAENVMLDKLITRVPGVIDWPAVHRAARRHMERVGLDVPVDSLARDLSAAQQQLVEIARALSADVKVLLLDEPTSALTEHEARRLFELLCDLRSRGVAVIFVSHKLEEVCALCDRVSVLRDGRVIGTRAIGDATTDELVDMMIGRECATDHLGPLAPELGVEVLRAEHIVRRGAAEDVSFSLHRGEVLGWYGLVGSGRTELARILIGEEPMDAGQVWLHGRRVEIRGVSEALHRHRLAYVSENRQREGVFLDDDVESNLTVGLWPRLRHSLTRAIHRARATAAARSQVEALRVKIADLDQRVRTLSGGNQQKVSIGKWLAADCDILIIDEPTVGVDVGAKQQIHQLIWNLAARAGKSVIVISSDLPELVRLVNRLLVFRAQRIVGEVRDIDTQRKSYADVSREIAPYLV